MVRDGRAADISYVPGRIVIALLSVVTGVALELGIQALGGSRESWDSEQYWTIGLPAVSAIALLLGVVSRRYDWVLTALIIPSQILTMMVTKGEPGNLWPLAIIVGLILSAPFVVIAFVGSRVRKLVAPPGRQ